MYTITQRVEVTPRDHVVIVAGRAYHVQRVTVTHRREAGEELWESFSNLWPAWTWERGEISRNELDEVPAWLLEVEAQALADLPTSW
jgi:hypothetical protein